MAADGGTVRAGSRIPDAATRAQGQRQRLALVTEYHLGAAGGLVAQAHREWADALDCESLFRRHRARWDETHDAGQPYPGGVLLEDATAHRDERDSMLRAAVFHLLQALLGGGWL